MKQTYENVKHIKLVGLLEKNNNNEFIVTVTDKDDTQVFKMEDILNMVEGQIISLVSDSDSF